VRAKAVGAIMYEDIGPKGGLQRAQQEAQVSPEKAVPQMR
jgi:hypothetical protein